MEYRENAHSWCAHRYMPYIVIYDEWKVYVLGIFFNELDIQGTRARPEYQYALLFPAKLLESDILFYGTNTFK